MRRVKALLAVVATLVACGGDIGAPTAVDPLSGGPRWSAPEKIDPTSTHDRNPALAVSARGEMVAIWLHEVIGGRGFAFNDGLRASRFTFQTGWDASAPIPATKGISGAAVVMDDAGTRSPSWALPWIATGSGRATRAAPPAGLRRSR
jgi:hypothetical protein